LIGSEQEEKQKAGSFSIYQGTVVCNRILTLDVDTSMMLATIPSIVDGLLAVR
jgi:hypothetical protein